MLDMKVSRLQAVQPALRAHWTLPCCWLLACPMNSLWLTKALFGEINTVEEVDYLIDCLVEIMDKLRNMSPLYEDFVKGENKMYSEKVMDHLQTHAMWER